MIKGFKKIICYWREMRSKKTENEFRLGFDHIYN